jgi:small-conductance mechanosensitive channel
MAEEFSNLWDTISGAFGVLLNQLLLAALVILAGFILGKLAGKLITRILHELEINSMFKSLTGSPLVIDELVGNAISFLVYFSSIVIALFILGVGTLAFNIIAILILVLILAAVIISLRDFVPNYMAGLAVHRRRVKVGDTIEILDTRGKIIYIGTAEVKLQTKQGEIIYVPNVLFLREATRVRKD